MDEVRDLDYWTYGDGRAKQLVDLDGVRCRRCPHPIGLVPRDKVMLLRESGDYRRSFVCPHCRTEVSQRVARDEALRLYVEGVSIVRRPWLEDVLTREEISRFADELHRADDVVDRVLGDAAA
jgi:hypothetical protein